MKLRICRLIAITAFVTACVLSGAQNFAQNAYITNSDSNNVSVINTVTNMVIATVPVDLASFGVAISPRPVAPYPCRPSWRS